MAIYALLASRSVSHSVLSTFAYGYLSIDIELDIMVSLVTRKSVKYYSADVFC